MRRAWMEELKNAGDDTQAVTGERGQPADVLGRGELQSRSLACAVLFFVFEAVICLSCAFLKLSRGCSTHFCHSI